MTPDVAPSQEFSEVHPLSEGFLCVSEPICMPRRRGEGIGRLLLRSLIERGSGRDIYLTTLGSTTEFYEREGFSEVSSRGIPRRECRPVPQQSRSASNPNLFWDN